MNNQIKFILSILTLFILFISCEKDEVQPQGKTNAIFNESLTYGTVIDIDGNVYRTIEIGNQVWMAENLRVTHFNNGELISRGLIKMHGYPSTAGNEPEYGSYNETNDKDSIATFGLLYNWASVSDSRGIAPKGWHIPSKEEWELLISTLGGGTEAELKLREVGKTHWYYLNLGDNTSGFTALPSGQYNTGNFYGIGDWTAWWTSTGMDDLSAFAKQSSTLYPGEIRSTPLHMGLSIRCVKD
ncbi:fibrobacter succinogenes major paralogous domain-containing protein [Carboxylicivirga sp. M1479]|uniref:fibrobacter succinogenes major paralogous domain-containing protein n=1 Tax=Carboxylicivirga sp. M1479 TaxID=2594476 RepID=UPI00163D4F68|nr:fibrobacter succinogenes major paralogous domain-containing protein [Carboxylicivirga sp. M1479]